MKVRKLAIESGLYEGYLWFCDESKPSTVFLEPKSYSLEKDASEYPFIVEGMLFDKERNISYNIRYVDGFYFLSRYDLSQNPNREEYDDRFLFPKEKSLGKMKFRQYWKEYISSTSLNMPVLKPSALVFVGFIH